MGLLMSSAFRFSLYILPIPMFDRRDHPSVPTMIGLGHGGGRRSRMARRATAEGGGQGWPAGPPPKAEVKDGPQGHRRRRRSRMARRATAEGGGQGWPAGPPPKAAPGVLEVRPPPCHAWTVGL